MIMVRRWVLVMGVTLPLAVLAETPQDFSGDWVVAARDQQAKSKADSSSPGSHHGGGHGGAGMGGGHGMSGASGRHHAGGPSSPDSAGNAVAGDPHGDPRLAAQTLAIRQSDVVFDVAADGGKRMVYRFDNRNNYGPAYGGTVTLTWATPEMVIETHPDGGGSIEEHYTLSDDGRKLSLRVHEQHAGTDTAQNFTRVFVRSGSQDAATATTLP